MYRSILVPLDGSAFAEAAIPLALSIADRAGAHLNSCASMSSTRCMTRTHLGHLTFLPRKRHTGNRNGHIWPKA